MNLAKIVLAALILLAAIWANFYFATTPVAIRSAGMIVAVLLALAVIAFTSQGQRMRQFLVESNFELRKVVWPTRQETLQTTLVVIVVVLILSVILWLIDIFLGAVILEWLLKA